MGRDKNSRPGVDELRNGPAVIRVLEICELETRVESEMARRPGFPALEDLRQELQQITIQANIGTDMSVEIVKSWNKFNEIVAKQEVSV
jgi:hypothetical protein